MDYSAVALPKFISTGDNPTDSFALKSPERKFSISTIEEEFDTLAELGTWEEAPMHSRYEPIILADIVLRLKRDEQGLPARFKVGVVARGECQQEKFDYGALFSPVACAETVWIFDCLYNQTLNHG